MYKTAIAPVIAVVCLALKGLLGIEIPETLQGEIVNVVSTLILIGVSVYGIFKTHKKAQESNSPSALK